MVRHNRVFFPLLFSLSLMIMTVADVRIGYAQDRDSVRQQRAPESEFQIDGEIGLDSLMTISDGHIQDVVDSLELFSQGVVAGTADWVQIRPLLARVAERNVPSLTWFAATDGAYWTVEGGRASGNLSRRSYWPRVLAGSTIVAELEIGLTTQRAVAVVAAPIIRNNRVIGVLGSSIYLDDLSDLIAEEMGLEGRDTVFFAFNDMPRIALNSDTSLIFRNPKNLGTDLSRAIDEMLGNEEGFVTYSFNGQRSVYYRKSPLTDWWYAFGIVEDAAED